MRLQYLSFAANVQAHAIQPRCLLCVRAPLQTNKPTLHNLLVGYGFAPNILACCAQPCCENGRVDGHAALEHNRVCVPGTILSARLATAACCVVFAADGDVSCGWRGVSWWVQWFVLVVCVVCVGGCAVPSQCKTVPGGQQCQCSGGNSSALCLGVVVVVVGGLCHLVRSMRLVASSVGTWAVTLGYWIGFCQA